jgi:hypothetical protein
MTALSRTIHTGFSQLGIRDDAEKRAIYSRVTGVDQLKVMTVGQEEKVLAELRRLGFNPAARRSAGQPDMTGKFSPKIRALWIALYNLGAVQDRRDSAITAFVKGQVAIDRVRFVHRASDANAIIEALKAIAARHGVDWSVKRGDPPWRKAHGYHIAVAQWAKINPQGAGDFWAVVTDLIDVEIIGKDATYRDLTDKEWMFVMNDFGKRVRALPKASGV